MKKILSILVIAFFATTANAQNAVDLYANDGTYLGNNGNRYDPNSVNNPYGQYGSKYSQDSINNPYGTYGSRYSAESPNNPYGNNGRAVNNNANTYKCFGANKFGGC